MIAAELRSSCKNKQNSKATQFIPFGEEREKKIKLIQFEIFFVVFSNSRNFVIIRNLTFDEIFFHFFFLLTRIQLFLEVGWPFVVITADFLCNIHRKLDRIISKIHSQVLGYAEFNIIFDPPTSSYMCIYQAIPRKTLMEQKTQLVFQHRFRSIFASL